MHHHIIPKINICISIWRETRASVDGNKNKVVKVLLNSTCKKGGFSFVKGGG
jgi:hypothetical protein